MLDYATLMTQVSCSGQHSETWWELQRRKGHYCVEPKSELPYIESTIQNKARMPNFVHKDSKLIF